MGIPLLFLGLDTLCSFPPQNSAWGPNKHLLSSFCLYFLRCNVFPWFLDLVCNTECYLAKCVFSQATWSPLQSGSVLLKVAHSQVLSVPLQNKL